VPAALHVANGFGKLLGVTQLRELGELETPILLTCTLCVWRAADAMTEWMLELPGMERCAPSTPWWGRPTTAGSTTSARPVRRGARACGRARAARGGPVEEGSGGRGDGDGGVRLEGRDRHQLAACCPSLGGWTVGVLVQSNFGGVLQGSARRWGASWGATSSSARCPATPMTRRRLIMIIIATDAPLSDRNLEPLAARAMMGLGAHRELRVERQRRLRARVLHRREVRRAFDARAVTTVELANEQMSAVFQAVVEAVEEAILNSLFAATTRAGNGRTVEAIPLAALTGTARCATARCSRPDP
jgi:D-aminopeptidase